MRRQYFMPSSWPARNVLKTDSRRRSRFVVRQGVKMSLTVRNKKVPQDDNEIVLTYLLRGESNNDSPYFGLELS